MWREGPGVSHVKGLDPETSSWMMEPGVEQVHTKCSLTGKESIGMATTPTLLPVSALDGMFPCRSKDSPWFTEVSAQGPALPSCAEIHCHSLFTSLYLHLLPYWLPEVTGLLVCVCACTCLSVCPPGLEDEALSSVHAPPQSVGGLAHSRCRMSIY